METVKNITYKAPVRGTSTSNPLYTEDGAGVTESGQTTTLIADMTSRQLLESILLELKKLNLRQEAVFNETVTDEDVLCE
jgi:hypothetical protein